MLFCRYVFKLGQGVSKGKAEITHGVSASMKKHHKEAHKLFISSVITNVSTECLMPPKLTFLLHFLLLFLHPFFLLSPSLFCMHPEHLSYQVEQ